MASLPEELQHALADRYRIERELGHGGMATVYLARDVKHDRRVAIKVLHPDLARSVGPERFLQEIQIAAQLNHPHVLTLIDSGEADGFLYYVMPYVEGESLRTRLARESELPIGETVRILRDVVDALAYAHRHGVVHRDVKPDNVLILENHAVVTDFGVAKAVSEATGRQQLTTAGVALGTPAYMAPEQAAADPHVDHRADIYAVGAMAYEMLTGRPPFTGMNPQQVFAAHVSQAPAPVTGQRDTVPPPLAELVMRCLAKKPADRWQSADELLHHLEAAATPSGGMTPTAAGVPATAAGTARVPRGGGWVRWAAGAAALVAVGALGWFAAGQRTVADASSRPMLAVLPFQNLGDAGDEYFADGITEEITSRLAEIREIGVISRTSAMQYKGTTKPLRQIGEELGVEYVLEGTVRWQKGADASRVRVTPQVIRVSDDTHLWTDRYDAVLSDVFAVQAEIAAKVAAALGVALAPSQRAEVSQAPTDNLEAYDYYLRGRDYYRRGWNPDDMRAAADLYEKAVALDPTFAAAWAELSTTYSQMYWFFVDRTEAHRARAKAAADSALQYGPDLAGAHIALGNYYYWGFRDYERALAAFARARQLQPNNADIYWAIGIVQRRQGRWEDAVASHRRKLELDPRDYPQVLDLAFTLAAMRRFDDARELVERAAALAPDWVTPLVTRAYLRIAADGDTVAARTALRSLSDPVKAANALAELTAVSFLSALTPWVGPGARRTLLGAPVQPGTVGAFAFMVKGDLAGRSTSAGRSYYDSALALLEPVARQYPDEAEFRVIVGSVYSRLGRHWEAIAEMERAVDLIPVERDALDGATYLGSLAGAYVAAGHAERALPLLERLLELPSPYSRDLVRVHPDLAPLRGNPRFERLVRR